MKTILVVEDYSNVRHLLCKALQSKGYQTLSAATSLEAYDMLWHHAADISLVLSDVGMTDTRGFDLLRTIKSDPSMEAIPVAFWTNDNRSEDYGLVEVANLFTQKAFRDETFFNPIHKAIGVKGCMVNLV